MNRCLRLGSLLVCATASVALWAQSPPAMPPPAERFKIIDANHDGKVTLEEFKVAREKEMQEMAKNGSPPPAASGRPQMSPEETFKRIDANGDGYITQDEFVKYFEAMFKARAAGSEAPK